MTLDRQRTGDRTFDYNNDGVAHYGLYADWTDEVRKLGGPQIADDLLNGPEAYLQMWERAVGVPPTRCLPSRARLRARGLPGIRLGWTTGRKTRVAYVVHGKRVRTMAIAGPEARGRKVLRAYLRLVPSTGLAPRGTLVASRASSKRLTPRISKSLVETHEHGRFAFYCQIGL